MLRRDDLDRLAVVAQLEPDDAGVLRIAALGAPIDPTQGVRVRGTTVQFGLTEDEIDEVWERIQALIAKVDGGAADGLLARTIHEARSEDADSDGGSRPSDRRPPQAY